MFRKGLENCAQSVGRFLIRQRIAPKSLLHKMLLMNHRTMLDTRRLRNLTAWCRNLQNIPGSLVECGVAKGGCLAVMAHYAGKDQNVWGFDSFGAMPELSAEDEGSGQEWVGYQCAGEEGEKAVERTFELLGVDMTHVTVVKGYFEDTLQRSAERLKDIVILRLDNDWYRSTKFCLNVLYPKVVPGGVILIDDYGTFQGCRRAVDEYRTEHNISIPLIRTPGQDNEYYWIKP